MTAPRPPKAPPAPRGPRLHLNPIRPAESVALDGATQPLTRGRTIAMPPYQPWGEFIQWFRNEWKQGQHITMVGTTGSGKTTLARQLVSPPWTPRTYTIVLATKRRDPSLYEPLQAKGFKVISSVDGINLEEKGSRYIFRPRFDVQGGKGAMQKAIGAQADAFAELLVTAFDEGEWCLYCDEIRYLTDNLGLRTELETLWLQGRSLGVSIVAATQAPVSIPLLAFDQATHLFLWKNNDAERIKRMSEFAGSQNELVRATIPQLPKHEALYVNTDSDVVVRTQVDKRNA